MPRKIVLRARRHGEKEWKEIAAADSNHSELIESFRRDILEPKTNEDFADAELSELKTIYQRSGMLTKDGHAKAADAEAKRIAKEDKAFEAAREAKQKKTEKVKAEVFTAEERAAMAEEKKRIDAANQAKAPKVQKAKEQTPKA